MDEHLTALFCREAGRQARFGLTAASDLEQALAVYDSERVWYSVQALLVATGNVSKLLWAPSELIAGRSAYLRQVLGVSDDSPIGPRIFRNHFEHFDNRLEKWAASSVRRNFADSNIGPPGMIVGLEPNDYLRNLDTAAYAVTFRGDMYPLHPITAALRQIQAAAQARESKG